jgi:hypothetical protein
MIVNKKAIKKIRKDEKKLRMFVNSLLVYTGDDEHDYEVNVFDNYINDFYYLALKNKWEWFNKEIRPETIVEQIFDSIVYLLSHKKVDSISSGRIEVTKETYKDIYEINLKIDY